MTRSKFIKQFDHQFIRPRTDNGWINSEDLKPAENVSVLCFIPEEDNHVTTGMWDVSKVWVLLDEYRKPTAQVTYWRPIQYKLPKDQSYKPSHVDEVNEHELYLNKIKEVAECAKGSLTWLPALKCIIALVDEYKNSKS